MTYLFSGLALGFAFGYAIGKRKRKAKVNIPYILNVRFVETERMEK